MKKKKRPAYYTGFTNKRHPELREGEMFIQNIPSNRDLRHVEKFCSRKELPLRMGKIAYTPQGERVPKYRPVFGRAQKKGKK
jgi:hypothetical protein